MSPKSGQRHSHTAQYWLVPAPVPLMPPMPESWLALCALCSSVPGRCFLIYMTTLTLNCYFKIRRQTPEANKRAGRVLTSFNTVDSIETELAQEVGCNAEYVEGVAQRDAAMRTLSLVVSAGVSTRWSVAWCSLCCSRGI